ncbi:MAG: hypothetical protein L6Q73_03075 [Aquabacterium sp.]|nr:hypothetical protein [Aquabacterium sp.]
MRAVIVLHVQAPPKPPVGQPCNGCGVCCAWQPCPLGMVVSRRRHGRCSALRWVDEERRYRCGVLWAPSTYLPGPLRWLEPLLARLALRWIAAGSGCDCDADTDTEG